MFIQSCMEIISHDLEAFHSKVVEGAANVSSREFLSTIFNQTHMTCLNKMNLNRFYMFRYHESFTYWPPAPDFCWCWWLWFSRWRTRGSRQYISQSRADIVPHPCSHTRAMTFNPFCCNLDCVYKISLKNAKTKQICKEGYTDLTISSMIFTPWHLIKWGTL